MGSETEKTNTQEDINWIISALEVIAGMPIDVLIVLGGVVVVVFKMAVEAYVRNSKERSYFYSDDDDVPKPSGKDDKESGGFVPINTFTDVVHENAQNMKDAMEKFEQMQTEIDQINAELLKIKEHLDQTSAKMKRKVIKNSDDET